MLVSLDTEWFSNPKIVAAGKDGRALWLASLLYSHQNGTEGIIPKSVLETLCGLANVPPETVNTLTEPWIPGRTPLWETCDDNTWMIHDFNKYGSTTKPVRRNKTHTVDVNSDAHKIVAHLAQRVSAHTGRDIKTVGWDKHADMLQRRGPQEWATPTQIPANEIHAMIDHIFDNPQRSDTGFAWADVIRSTNKLRAQWPKLVTWKQQTKPKHPLNPVRQSAPQCQRCGGSTFIPNGRSVSRCPDCQPN